MTPVLYSYFKNIDLLEKQKFKRVETFRHLLTMVVNKAKKIMSSTGTLEAIAAAFTSCGGRWVLRMTRLSTRFRWFFFYFSAADLTY